MNTIVQRIQDTYAQLNRDTVHSELLGQLYAENIVFSDPLHHIESLENLKSYFEGMYKNVTRIHFEFLKTIENEQDAFLTWNMTFEHPKLSNGKPIEVPGTTHIQHDGKKVTYHKDYFDSTHMIFDHIPVIKSVIKTIKNRLN